jgi:electron transport complex protein RnfC
MIFRRYGQFTGGIDLPEEKQATLGLPIAACGKLPRLRVPLSAGGGPPAEPVVGPSQRVEAGQLIARSPDGGSDVFAPLGGRVAGPAAAQVAARGRFAEGPAIELTDLADPEPIRPLAPQYDWRQAPPEELLQRLAGGGLVIHRPPHRPLLAWVLEARRQRCEALIANVMEHQPYVTADHRLLAEHGTEVIRGLEILAKACGTGKVILAVDRRRTDAYRALIGTARRYRVTPIALSHKYPTGNDTMLVKVLRRREVPAGGSATDVGAAVTDAATCFAAYRWVACGAPATARVVTVSGPRAAAPGNYWVPFGAGCLELIGHARPPVVHGGPMMGLRCGPGAVVAAGTDAVLALEAAARPAPTPCIRCGWCTDHCPARLNVAALNDAFELCEVDRADHLGAVACVECGVCSYVCPARLPLSQRVRELKGAIAAARPAPRTACPPWRAVKGAPR